jgi:hypothetical protein
MERWARVVSSATSLFGIVHLAWAGPLDPSVVDKDATWLFHLDVEAGMASTCGRFAQDGIAKDPEAIEGVKKFGIDATKDVKSLTVYGFKPGEDDGVAILVTNSAIDKLPAKLKEEGAEDFESHIEAGITHLNWKADGRPWHLAIKARNDDRLVLIASATNILETGLAVARGDKGSLNMVEAEKVAPMLQKPSKGSIFFVAARGLADCPKFKASLFKEAHSLLIDVGEEAGKETAAKETYAKIAIETADEQTATSMQQMVQGLIGLACMTARSNDMKGVPESLQGVKVAAEGATLVISARESSEDLAKQLKELGAAIKATSDGHMGVSIQQTKGDGKKAPEAAPESAPAKDEPARKDGKEGKEGKKEDK